MLFRCEAASHDAPPCDGAVELKGDSEATHLARCRCQCALVYLAGHGAR